MSAPRPAGNRSCCAEVTWKFAIFWGVICITCLKSSLVESLETYVYSLTKSNNEQKVDSRPTSRLVVFCYEGEEYKAVKLWTTATLRLVISEEDYELFKGANTSAVQEQYHNAMKSWFNLLPWKKEEVTMDTFRLSCLGVATKTSYSVKLKIRAIDPWLITYLFLGLILFFNARRLSKNIVFYYGTGMTVGLLASCLIIVFIVSRFVPRKTGYVVLVGGWSFSLFLLNAMWSNVQNILETYSHYVLGYFAVAGLLTLAVLYWRGPVTDPRSLNLIKWTLQLCALGLVYGSTRQIQEVAISTIIVILTIHCFPRKILHYILSVWRRRFPPKVHLLSEEEYQRQADEYTRQQLESLRQYCLSPKCDAWRTISRINSPSRFASFVEGDSHITDTELLDYDSDPAPHYGVDLDDSDESEMSFRLNSP
ncbi:nuclear envelope integral membrane protein 1-like [Lingula anatina]|uniref:Nuclear envelope integral membrane protein 1-like n=1 Tax=Lingula anatina TaxID=7574 RepID=A0A1S3JUY8_LINAN|nr:nuclear envelope integral membrane protein 1-like [Lingula anatina]|eukprot:XP_013413904.1 nuclear envelope integral membrane protein 1-like [Lingula anatina]